MVVGLGLIAHSDPFGKHSEHQVIARSRVYLEDSGEDATDHSSRERSESLTLLARLNWKALHNYGHPRYNSSKQTRCDACVESGEHLTRDFALPSCSSCRENNLKFHYTNKSIRKSTRKE
ncbi:hypothetical protein IWZ00DRAFT_488755 [Phyllosticta capitalensis]|uniref:uncharacterized protein n=1 Tax=Phyllosticta capitalensis TaxID=121624 RepID=UPI00312FE11E